MSTHTHTHTHFQNKIKAFELCEIYEYLQLRKKILGFQEQVQNSRGKRAIGVRAIKFYCINLHDIIFSDLLHVSFVMHQSFAAPATLWPRKCRGLQGFSTVVLPLRCPSSVVVVRGF